APGAGGDARRLPAPGPAPGQGRGRGRGWGGGRAGGPLFITGPWGRGYTRWRERRARDERLGTDPDPLRRPPGRRGAAHPPGRPAPGHRPPAGGHPGPPRLLHLLHAPGHLVDRQPPPHPPPQPYLPAVTGGTALGAIGMAYGLVTGSRLARGGELR